MPRKRKKSSIARKPTLMFTESPVHIQKNVPSPVLCARHPPTASSVPVEELHDLHWVSPQFRSVRHSGGHGKRRLTRQRRHSVASLRHTSCHGNYKENVPTTSALHGLHKFKSLKFIGDKSSISSIVEDIEVTIDTDTATDDDDEENVNGNLKVGDGRNSRKSKLLSPSRNPLKNSERFTENIKKQERVFGVRPKIEKIESENAGGEKRVCLELSENVVEDISGFNSTQRRSSLKDNPPIKRLFASQLPQNTNRGGEKYQDFEENVELLQTNARVTREPVECLTLPDSEEELVNSPNLRRSARIQKIMEMLQSSGSPNCSFRRKHVLAPNTPENEYGWSKRKRQLISYIKKKS